MDAVCFFAQSELLALPNPKAWTLQGSLAHENSPPLPGSP